MAGAEPALTGAAAAPFAQRAIDRAAEASSSPHCSANSGWCSPTSLARVFPRIPFFGRTKWRGWSLSILAFIGGAVAYRRRDHAFVRIVLNLFPQRASAPALCWQMSSCCSSPASIGLRLDRIHRVELGRTDPDFADCRRR